jgi:hypothetical protein
MAKEPRQPAGSGDRTDDRQNSWEQRAFGADEAPAAQPVDLTEDGIAAVVHEKSEELGEALHGKFVQLLSAKLRAKDGKLTPADVKEMGDAFRRELKVIETVFLDAIKTYALGQAADRQKQNRTHFFRRLLVRKFEDRFADERTLRERPEMLSRRMLPGFFNMLAVMFGKPKLENYEKQAEKVAAQLSRRSGGDHDWSSFYRTQEASRIALQAEIEIASYFRDIEKRLNWMIAVVNSSTIPPKETAAGEPWVFNQPAAENLLTGLFRDVGPALKQDQARQALTKQVGNETLETLDKVARRFG